MRLPLGTAPFPQALQERRLRGSPMRMCSCFGPTLSVCCFFFFFPYKDLSPAAKLTFHSLGYVRIVLAVASLYYMPLHPRTCSFLYSVSCLLDALDGLAARHFDQSTTFGAVLDMVTDRCTTACLLVFLSSAWPRWAILFQGLISLDLASHYMHMYATLSMGGSGQSHKKVDSSRSWILYQYYNSRVRLSQLCSSSVQSADLSDRAFHLLRSQRAVLHRPVPAVLLVADAVAFSPAAAPEPGVWAACPAGPHSDFPQPLERRRPRIGPCQQAGQLLALGDHGDLRSGYGAQAVH